VYQFIKYNLAQLLKIKEVKTIFSESENEKVERAIVEKR
jgi:hypothetical protein